MKILVLLLAMSLVAVHQQAQTAHALTNTDIVGMTKAGIADDTIILMIQKSSNCAFDTSPDGLIELKKNGVAGAVMSAMITASKAAIVGAPQDCAKALDSILDGIGPRETLLSIHSIRWNGTEVVTTTRVDTYTSERITVYPSDFYFARKNADRNIRMVITPQFNYVSVNDKMSAVPLANLLERETAQKFDPIYIAQHRGGYSCILQDSEQIGNLRTERLKISDGRDESLWNVNPSTNRLVRSTTGPITVEYSDWRSVGGIFAPFARRSSGDGVVETTVTNYEVNSTLDAGIFQPPSQPIRPVFKVLQAQSTPYTIETNGGVSTSCSISGSTSTSINGSINSSTYGNTTNGTISGTATSTPNLRMNCNSSDNTIRWKHTLNAMLVEASDGNAYIIACDAAWRWSKCSSLRAGETFAFENTSKGFVVEFVKGGKDEEATYKVVQSKSLH